MNWQGKFIQNRYCIYFTLESRNGRYKIFRSCTQRIDSSRLYNVLYYKRTGNQNILDYFVVLRIRYATFDFYIQVIKKSK